MNYRLKDRELQRKLDEISDGSFSSRLADVSGEIPNLFRQGISTRIYFGDKYQFYLHATQDMLEEVPEYDPHGWNDFPEVEPPEGVLMRCEWIDCDGITHHFAATCAYVVNRFEWYDDEGGEVEVSRFRPWEDEE